MDTRTPLRPVEFEFADVELRSLPFPEGSSPTGRVKLGTCFLPVDDLPDELKEWMGVNPRRPQLSAKGRLKGPVAKRMVETLTDDPSRFVLKNMGIYLLVDGFDQQKEEGGRSTVRVRLSDPALHGIVNGGHTFHAIMEAREQIGDGDSLNAHVRVHLMQGVHPDDIVELAEGLNRSAQVNDASLAELTDRFDLVKRHLDGKTGADKIIYKSGDVGTVSVEQVLGLLSLFDVNRFSDRNTHPNTVFGHPKGVLDFFLADTKPAEKCEPGEVPARSFERIAPRSHEILVLSERIKQRKEMKSHFGSLKVGESKTSKYTGAGNERFRNQKCTFAPGHFHVKFMQGWLYPMLAAFRANVDREAWKEGQLEWLMDPLELLDAAADEMAKIISQVHKENNGKPAEVGRKEGAYRSCYHAVAFKLAQDGHPIV
ncbi:AIPR family protein [Alienimonas californiensis]|uniref:AIPR protein n=1 Tax=Alienimonas californiensis TaxID=2527989 RepID=A0A517PBQ4_9PLAN|nr:AIPR family protein [Alienimonas californiensis]QDT16791.1 AIPR protein [Alienimonas californiensis]